MKALLIICATSFLIIISAIALTIIMPHKSINNKNYGFNTIIIDSCEYIYKRTGGCYSPAGCITTSGTQYITHKGNCKFCKERNKLSKK